MKKIIILSGDPNSINSEIIFKSWKKIGKSLKKRIYLISNYKLIKNQFKKLGYSIKVQQVKNIDESSKNDSLKIINIDLIYKNPFKVSLSSNQKFVIKCLNLGHKLSLNKNISGIILQMPMLYVTQSLLTLTTMSGYHPNPSGIIEKSGVYESSFLPDLFLITFQKYYGFIINFWYIFCSYVFLHSLFNRHVNSRNLKIIVSIIPLYYGAFTSFATFSEFYRHMIVVIPLILYNYIIVLNILRDSFKNILVICFQPKKYHNFNMK